MTFSYNSQNANITREKQAFSRNPKSPKVCSTDTDEGCGCGSGPPTGCDDESVLFQMGVYGEGSEGGCATERYLTVTSKNNSG